MTFEEGVATFTLKDGEEITAANLPTDTEYEIKEDEYDNYIVESTNEKGTIKEETTSVDFVNKYSPTIQPNRVGNLKVTKTVEGENGEKDKDFTFKITLNDNAITGKYGDMTFEGGVATFTLKDGEEITATNLPTDIEYEVKENKYANYTTKSTNEKGIIKENETSIVNVVNTRKEKSESVLPEFLPFTGLNDPLRIIANVILVILVIMFIQVIRIKYYSKHNKNGKK